MKYRIEILTIIEIEPNPENYPSGISLEEMMAIDIDNADNYPFEFMGIENSITTVTGEIIENKN